MGASRAKRMLDVWGGRLERLEITSNAKALWRDKELKPAPVGFALTPMPVVKRKTKKLELPPGVEGPVYPFCLPKLVRFESNSGPFMLGLAVVCEFKGDKKGWDVKMPDDGFLW
eukprot:GDKI01026272.1.p2 GENE.GDKI01026272.1~~GDKI01026272.1.p2  ORF type:complete len:114 (+),score=35.74 GDKI01026272.1:1-342(+)